MDDGPEAAWTRMARTLDEMRRQLASGTAEEHFQAVGLHGREALISLGQAVFEPAIHKAADGKDISPTDAPRMLEAYFDSALGGSGNEEARKFAKAALSLAVALQH